MFLLVLLKTRYTLDDMAHDAQGLPISLEISSCHVVGHSMGGMIAQLFCINHPSWAKSLTIASSSSDVPGVTNKSPAPSLVNQQYRGASRKGGGVTIVGTMRLFILYLFRVLYLILSQKYAFELNELKVADEPYVNEDRFQTWGNCNLNACTSEYNCNAAARVVGRGVQVECD